jgi:pimeloyl-ACP methyl ester carboxylesterase
VSARIIDVHGRAAAVLEAGSGEPLVYLHGFADVHAAPGELQPFHERLAKKRRLIAPALPGVNGSAELDYHTVDDQVFHHLQVFDALGLKTFDLVGHCAGGWIAAEIAVRHPEKVRSLTLIGATGLFVQGHLIGDVFMHAQPERGVDYTTLRGLLFSSPDHPIAQRYFPDGRADVETEIRRYQMLRYGSFVGFKPPYLYNRTLRDRLYRAAMPSRVIWGEKDAMVPLAHGRAYAEGLPGSGGRPHMIAGAGHAAHLEAPEGVAEVVETVLR